MNQRMGFGADDDDNRKKTCATTRECQEYIDKTHEVADAIDTIEVNMNYIKKFLAVREWTMFENAVNINDLKDGDGVDDESLKLVKNQSVRFERLVNNTLRAMQKIRSLCADFGGEDDSEE